MSPAKSPTSKTLTIEFAGICTFVWNKTAGTADVQLVDLSSAGFQRHYAALGLAITESTPRGIKGPDADAAVSLPHENSDMGLWNLLGTNVEIVGASGKLTVDDSKIDASKKPPKEPGSIRWVADIGFVCESDRLDPVCPTAATITLPAGHITSAGGAFARKLEFVDEGTPIGPDRYCVPRFKAVIPFERELALRLDRQRVLRFTDSMEIVVSNTCVCGLGMGAPVNHFYGHYEVVEAKRKPTVKAAGKQPKTIWFPEWCIPGVVRT